MKTISSKLALLLPVFTAVGSVVVFAATYMVYFNAHRGAGAGYLPFIVGTISFFALLTAAYFAASKNGVLQILHAVLASLVGTAVFVYVLIFMLLNTLGS